MLTTIKVLTKDLEQGMYVSALDRSWLETPFPIQGFQIENQQQIEQLRNFCTYVMVDARKSRQGESSLQSKLGKGRKRQAVSHIFKGRDLAPYRDDSNFEEEHPRAVAALDTLVEDLWQVFEQVNERGKIRAAQLKRAVEPLIGSVSRNPDACLWITRLKHHDEYSYHKALSTAIWAVTLGRELGLPRTDLRSLAMGAMLMDVGKLRIDPKVLKANRKLKPDEVREVRRHVSYGQDILNASGILNQDVVDMVAHHHERYDGSGYPAGLKGDEIPPVARVAGIVDTYGSLTSERPYARAMSPSAAIRTLYELRDIKFQAELVESFIKAIGVYPAGTLVELSSGEVGVVVAESRVRRLKPKVMLLLDDGKRSLAAPRVVDLQSEADNDEPLLIRRSLEPGAYRIDLSAIKVPGL
ncbi:HD-GYP domain-containing protein [Parahaliea aestuarii]|uniref:HD-GYP domain-containing protein n=1 Tax=Parahaliea aestuarii TaxID=1852021 RepID=A0A5C8ZNJ3_9GAMM|nr:HD-GYP domain-containing protein [Parahaliea aestuarii]TXS89324.1 HD-GYP domain-containing protein [Parahaliea aestuarii]